MARLRNGGDVDVEVLGCDSSGENCVHVWWAVAADDDPTSIFWEEAGIRETAVSTAYPIYKIRQHCRYGGGSAGCKFTGYYFAVENSSPVTATPTTVPTETPIPPTATPTGVPTVQSTVIHLQPYEMLEVHCYPQATPSYAENNGIVWLGCVED